MTHHEARPKAPKRPRAATAPSPAPDTAARPAPRKIGRPPKGEGGALVSEFQGVTVRVEPALLARIDAEVERRNAASRAQGYTTSRGAVMALALREFCDRAEAAAAERAAGGPQ